MKDACHHLKHLQKKVIQSSRKAEALESINHTESVLTVPSKPSGGSSVRKKTSPNQMRRESLRNALH